MQLICLTCFFLFGVFSGALSSKVLELSDKFIDFSTDGLWFVKFYAPWCAHCRRMEPIWAHVAQALYNTPVKVAKIDCTRFSSVGTHFKVRAYPTIMFIKGSYQYEYTGERVKEDMVNYALRMSQPAVKKISGSSFDYLKEIHPVFFGYIGKQQGPLWEMFTNYAEKYQPHSWFYYTSHYIVKEVADLTDNDNVIFVCKGEELISFEATPDLIQDIEALNATLNKWINSERFGFFPKITISNIKDIMDTEKYIVIAVLSENKLSEISQTERDFKDMIEGIIMKRKKELHNRFQFGWTGSTDFANSIAMTELTVPHLLVINSTTSHHHLPDDDPVLMTPEAVSIFLDQVHKQMAPTYGGNGWLVRVYRAFFEARTTLANMWRGNPVLTALVFGLPFGFLSLICYSICCADILEAEDDENSDAHEKTD